MILLWSGGFDLKTPGLLEAHLERHWQGDLMVVLALEDRGEAYLYRLDETLPPPEDDEWCSMGGDARVLAARLRGMLNQR